MLKKIVLPPNYLIWDSVSDVNSY